MNIRSNLSTIWALWSMADRNGELGSCTLPSGRGSMLSGARSSRRVQTPSGQSLGHQSRRTDSTPDRGCQPSAKCSRNARNSARWLARALDSL